MTNTFWTGGPSAYHKGMKADFQAKLAELESRLEECPAGQRETIELEIKELRAEYKRLRKGFWSLIF